MDDSLFGPIFGHTTEDSTQVWMRGRKGLHGAIRHRLRAADGSSTEWKVAAVPLEPSLDFTGVVEARFDTAPELHVEVGILDACRPAPSEKTDWNTEVQTIGTGRVRAAPKGDAGFAFILASCRHRGYGKWRRGDDAMRTMARHIAAKDASFVLLTGDQVYCGHPIKDTGVLPATCGQNVAPNSREGYFRSYRRAWSEPGFRDAHSRVPAYMIFDDHEIHNNWAGYRYRLSTTPGPGLPLERQHSDAPLRMGLRAYLAYQARQSPKGWPSGPVEDPYLLARSWWYEFSWGMADFFVLDPRSDRTDPEVMPRRLLQEGQWRALCDFLVRNERVKFIVSPVPIAPDTNARDKEWISDTWRSYPEQRQDLLDFIVANAPTLPIFLSGDIHLSTVVTIRHRDGLRIPSVVSSPLNWFIFGVQERGGLLSRWIEYLEHGPLFGGAVATHYTVHEETAPVKGNNFTRIEVNADSVRIQVIEAGTSGGTEREIYSISRDSLRNANVG